MPREIQERIEQIFKNISEKYQADDDDHTVWLDPRQSGSLTIRQQSDENAPAIKRRNGNQVENGQQEIDVDGKSKHQHDRVEEELQPGAVAERSRKGDDRAEQEGGDGGKQQIGNRTGSGNPDHVPFRVAEIVEIHRHRLCPADADDYDHESADDIKMLEWIQGQPAFMAGGIVTAQPGDIAVRNLMAGDCHQTGNQHDGEFQKELSIELPFRSVRGRRVLAVQTAVPLLVG